MKTIIDYITEKFKINSKTVNKIKLDFRKSDMKFSGSDLDDILDFARSLPIIPDVIKSADLGRTLVLQYLDQNDKKNIVRIYFTNAFFKVVKPNVYKVGFRKSLNDPISFYPPDYADHYTLDKCFDCIKNHWNFFKKYINKE